MACCLLVNQWGNDLHLSPHDVFVEGWKGPPTISSSLSKFVSRLCITAVFQSWLDGVHCYKQDVFALLCGRRCSHLQSVRTSCVLKVRELFTLTPSMGKIIFNFNGSQTAHSASQFFPSPLLNCVFTRAMGVGYARYLHLYLLSR